MLFNSFQFLIYFPVVFVFFFQTPQRWRLVFLLMASYYFYMAAIPHYILIIILLTLIDFTAGILIDREENQSRRRIVLRLSIIANLGLLFIFKYYDFFLTSLEDTATLFGTRLSIPHMKLILPLGISFHTFQSLSYTIDIYHRKLKPERKLLNYAVFVSFFPQLVAGPIERGGELLPQFRKKIVYSNSEFWLGLQLVLWGFFKKLVIADRISVLVDLVYKNPHQYSGSQLWLATYAFALQIYCDFSGYTDIARGIAKMMGFYLTENFRRPYFAQSLTDFWRRWHLSLSSWFRDYLYIPLGGNRGSAFRTYFNLMLVFAVSGLWHGASWVFLIWGVLHGSYLCVEKVWKDKASLQPCSGSKFAPFKKAILILITFHLVCFAWIFFRAKDIGSAFTIVQGMFNFNKTFVWPTSPAETFEIQWGFIFAGFAGILEYKIFESPKRWFDASFSMKVILRCLVLAVIIFIFGKLGSQEFVYFQF